MKHAFLGAAVVAAWAISLGGPALAAPPDAVTMMANTCVGCHGPNGSSLGPASPTIAGMATDTFVEAMTAYKEGKRPATVMDRIAKGYSDEEIKQMATYFSKQQFVRLPQKTDPALVKAGQALHKDHCEKCHVENGRKDEDGSNILAGQWLLYLNYSMDDFTKGGREMEKKMKAQVEKVQAKDPQGIEALNHFYASQK
jgi:sulfide dehydrogenase cytochrome subunit